MAPHGVLQLFQKSEITGISRPEAFLILQKWRKGTLSKNITRVILWNCFRKKKTSTANNPGTVFYMWFIHSFEYLIICLIKFLPHKNVPVSGVWIDLRMMEKHCNITIQVTIFRRLGNQLFLLIAHSYKQWIDADSQVNSENSGHVWPSHRVS